MVDTQLVNVYVDQLTEMSSSIFPWPLCQRVGNSSQSAYGYMVVPCGPVFSYNIFKLQKCVQLICDICESVWRTRGQCLHVCHMRSEIQVRYMSAAYNYYTKGISIQHTNTIFVLVFFKDILMHALFQNTSICNKRCFIN